MTRISVKTRLPPEAWALAVAAVIASTISPGFPASKDIAGFDPAPLQAAKAGTHDPCDVWP